MTRPSRNGRRPKMIILTFSSNTQDTTITPRVCSYLFSEDHGCFLASTEAVEQHLKRGEEHCFATLATFVRMPEMDLPASSRKNPYAYISVFVTHHTPTHVREASRFLSEALDVLRWMAQTDVVPMETLRILEHAIWASIPTFLRHRLRSLARRFIDVWASCAAEKYLAPDYVWKAAGPRCGRRTIDIFHTQFLSHVDTRNFHA
jgi:hypothetical protein